MIALLDRRARLALAILGTLAATPGISQQDADRFYLGAGLDLANHSARQNGVDYGDTPLGAATYGGVQLRDRMALEAAWQSFSSVSSGTIAGSGLSRLAIDSDVEVVVVRAVFSLDLGDAFPQAARWTVFGTAGAFSLDDRRHVSDLTFATTKETREEASGIALGAGVIYDLQRLRLRAALEQRDGGDLKHTSLGVTAEFRF